jgi:hypothetical protein
MIANCYRHLIYRQVNDRYRLISTGTRRLRFSSLGRETNIRLTADSSVVSRRPMWRKYLPNHRIALRLADINLESLTATPR